MFVEISQSLKNKNLNTFLEQSAIDYRDSIRDWFVFSTCFKIQRYVHFFSNFHLGSEKLVNSFKKKKEHVTWYSKTDYFFTNF